MHPEVYALQDVPAAVVDHLRDVVRVEGASEVRVDVVVVVEPAPAAVRPAPAGEADALQRRAEEEVADEVLGAEVGGVVAARVPAFRLVLVGLGQAVERELGEELVQVGVVGRRDLLLQEGREKLASLLSDGHESAVAKRVSKRTPRLKDIVLHTIRKYLFCIMSGNT